MLLLRDKARQVDAAISLIADELEDNARRIERFEGGVDIRWLMENLSFGTYERQAPIAFAYQRRHPELWGEVRAVYAELRNIAVVGNLPMAAGSLRELAARLRDTKF